jgi:hypothetical protein
MIRDVKNAITVYESYKLSQYVGMGSCQNS